MDSKRIVSIIGTGSYVPEKVLTNRDLEEIVDTTAEWIFSRTGMRERHIGSKRAAEQSFLWTDLKHHIVRNGCNFDHHIAPFGPPLIFQRHPHLAWLNFVGSTFQE